MERDKARIKPFCDQLAQLWENRCPDLRFGQIVSLLREAGATQVHFLSSAPEFLYPCYFGVDVDSRENLIAANHTLEGMREILGVDSLGFLSLEGVKKIAEGCNLGLCTGCFCGNYPAETPAVTEKSKFEKKFSESID